jgi:carbamoyltransferase
MSAPSVLAPSLWARLWRGKRAAEVRNILGIACSGHGASLALITREGTMRASVLDRWAGVKHLLLLARAEDKDIRNPKSDIDRLVHYSLKYGYGEFPHTRLFEDTIGEWLEWFLRGLSLTPKDIDLVVVTESHFAVCRSRLGRRLGRWFPNAAVSNQIEHHELHQRQAFWQSGFDEAAVLTLDSSGEPLKRLGGRLLAGSIAHMSAGGECRVLKEMLFPESSPGALYEVITRHCGFRLGDEGKTMGLAPYGDSELFDMLAPRLELHEDGSFHFMSTDDLRVLLQDYIPERWPFEEIKPRHSNVALAGQAILEKIVVNAFHAAHRLTGCRDLVYAGGVALNSVANQIAAREAQTGKLYIPPNPGDTGQSLGAALYGACEIAKWPKLPGELPDFLGPAYSDEEMVKATEGLGFPVSWPDDPERELARCIANGHITARSAGSAEFGPRALGNRSILCDPRGQHMKEHLNAKVKHRESFRPFAPAVLEDQASVWFDMNFRSPYMLRVVPVRPEMGDRIPAVVHVDGSCRVQTVSERDNPGFHRIIQEFAAITGVPLVLNTSFNLAGKPIVETPRDALECFAATEIAILALGPLLISKRPLHEYLQLEQKSA